MNLIFLEELMQLSDKGMEVFFSCIADFLQRYFLVRPFLIQEVVTQLCISSMKPKTEKIED